MTLSTKLRPGDTVLQFLPYEGTSREVLVTGTEPMAVRWKGYRVPATRVLGRSSEGRLFAVVTLAGFHWEKVSSFPDTRPRVVV